MDEVRRLAQDEPELAQLATQERAAAERHSFDLVATELDALYSRLTRKRRARVATAVDALPDREWIVVDLHMHTDWSHDCSIPASDLIDHAEHIGLGGIAVTDHNVFGGALEAVELGRRRDLVVIAGEEVKTDGQGEVIGLFLSEEIPRGMSFADSIQAIREQGGLVYLPHPFDRMHAIPDPATLHRHVAEIDVFEVFNARLLRDSFNDEALRFAQKYRLLMGAGSDAHACGDSTVPKSSSCRFERPRSCAGRSRSRISSRSSGWLKSRKRFSEREGAWDSVPAAVPTDEIYERYLKKAISEINELGDELARAGDELRIPVLGSGHPLADVFLLKFAPQPSEIQEGGSASIHLPSMGRTA